jgi:hypothetical protein
MLKRRNELGTRGAALESYSHPTIHHGGWTSGTTCRGSGPRAKTNTPCREVALVAMRPLWASARRTRTRLMTFCGAEHEEAHGHSCGLKWVEAGLCDARQPARLTKTPPRHLFMLSVVPTGKALAIRRLIISKLHLSHPLTQPPTPTHPPIQPLNEPHT